MNTTNEKPLIQIFESQSRLYAELVVVIDKALDNYFDYLDELMVCPETLHIKSLSPELFGIRADLADLYEIANRINEFGASHLRRVRNLGY